MFSLQKILILILALILTVFPLKFIIKDVSAAESSSKYKVIKRVNFHSEIQYTNVYGPGYSYSYYPEGLKYLLENNLYSEWKSLEDTFRFNSYVRITDNPIIDRERISIENLYLYFTRSNFEVNVGDYFANFSQYSFNSLIKGVSLKPKFLNFYIELISGTLDSQWEYLYEQNKYEPMDRYVSGFKIFIGNFDKKGIGLNYIYVWDNKNDKNRKEGEAAYQQHLVSFEWVYSFSRFNLKGEHAWVYYKTFLNGESSLEKSLANRIEGEADITEDLNWRFEIERVEPDFLTLGGSSTPDRFRVISNFKYYFSRKMRVFFRYTYYRNNLYHQLEDTTTVNEGEIGLIFKGLFGRRSGRYRISYKVRNKNDSYQYVTHWIRFSYYDRIKGARFKFKFMYLFENNYPGDNTRRYNYGFALSKQIRFKDFYFRPYIDINFDEVDISQETISRNYSFGFSFYKGRKWQGYFSYNKNKNDIRNGIDNKADRYQCRIDYLVGNFKFFKNLKVGLDLTSNKFRYSDKSQDYNENLAKLIIEWQI